MHPPHCVHPFEYEIYQQISFINTLKPRKNGCHFADDSFKCVFLNENVWISIEISLKFIPKGPINNIPALLQIMAWRRLGVKPLSEPMMVSLLTHICVTRPQWVNRRESGSTTLHNVKNLMIPLSFNAQSSHTPGRRFTPMHPYCLNYDTGLTNRITLWRQPSYFALVNVVMYVSY